MILLGVGIAAVVMIAYAIGRRAEERETSTRVPPPADAIAAAILVQLARAGGAGAGDAARIVREEAGLVAPPVADIDLASWAETFARAETRERREWLLDAAVRTSMRTGNDFPLAQYNALVDLSFSLGFQTDALARLRTRYSFTFEDYAKRNRPRSADRGATVAPLFERRSIDRQKMLAVLGLRGEVTRHDVISAYRRLAAKNHPDRFHDQPPEEQRAAAVRFMEITEAYEALLLELADS
jgi:DnaJ-domain-containing protein 1